MSVCADRAAIIEIINRYAYALDSREWGMLDQIFSGDAVARYGSHESAQLIGREAIVKSIRSFLGGCGPSQHLLGNHIVEIDGDSAISVCKARVYHYGSGSRSELEPYECFGIYRDQLRRLAEGWRISSRTFEVQLTVGDPEILQPN
ncbi:nuclear transport factor 2 family protein [Nocardia sp. CA-120079]|uniref:nuclear transport factor 2 family protein n=1 Tax=Nocardia sp. CA-120079 TaxID=3239974 RepID=UPI003D9652EC